MVAKAFISLGIACLISAPVLAEPGRLDSNRPPQVPIRSPEELSPPRQHPVGETMPEVVDAERGRTPLRLSLPEVFTKVLGQSPSLDKIQSRIREAQYKVDEAYTIVSPTADFSAQYSRVEPPVSFPGGPIISPANNYQLSLTLNQAIFTFGRLKWNTLAGKLSRRSIQEEYRGELNRLIGLTAQTYIQVLLAQEAVLIAQDNLEAQLAALRTSQLLFENGVAARFDVFRNEAEASKSQQDLIEAETSERIAKSRLLSLLGEPLGRPLELVALDLFEPENLQLKNTKVRALEIRPDLRSLRWAIEAGKARVEAARVTNAPTLALQNQTVNRNATGFSPGTQNTTAVVLTIPLYDGGSARLKAEQGREVVQQLTKDLEQAERQVTLEIEETYFQLQDAWRAIEVTESAVKQAEEALRVALLRYRNGISTNVELLDAQAARSQARFALAQKRAAYLQAKWTWWRVTSSEYPVEVPLSPEIRDRLDREGIPPSSGAMPEFSDKPEGSRLGPELSPKPEVKIPIRGLEQRPPEDSPK